MSSFKDFIQESKDRGFFYQCTDLDGLTSLLNTGNVTSYTGFDPTGSSLHVGHLMPLMWLRLFQRMGHTPIVLLGGTTSLIGDPSFKDTQRPLLSVEEIAQNSQSLNPIFNRYIDFSKTHLLNNADWLSPLNYIDFLRDYGRHFSVNRMLTLDSVKTRLEREDSLSFLEFNYMILQAFDFLHLYRHFGCQLQMAGSDQWGNIVNGIELARRMDGAQLYGLTCPLLTTASGAKMGKTVQGAIWLNPDRLDHVSFWNYWRNTHDADVGRFLKIFTDIPLDEIKRYEALQGQELNDAKKVLADAVTTLARGADVLPTIHQQIASLFEGGAGAVQTIDVPTTLLPLKFDAFCCHFQIADSKGEVKRLIQGKGMRINDVIVEDIDDITPAHFIPHLKISVGKKRHFVFSQNAR